MNSEEKELFRIAVLHVLNANRTRCGLGVDAVSHLVAAFGFHAPRRSDVEDALSYLTRRLFIEELDKPISPENRVWRIATPGIAFLDERG